MEDQKTTDRQEKHLEVIYDRIENLRSYLVGCLNDQRSINNRFLGAEPKTESGKADEDSESDPPMLEKLNSQLTYLENIAEKIREEIDRTSEIM